MSGETLLFPPPPSMVCTRLTLPPTLHLSSGLRLDAVRTLRNAASLAQNAASLGQDAASLAQNAASLAQDAASLAQNRLPSMWQ
jgi:hypothetical protein